MDGFGKKSWAFDIVVPILVLAIPACVLTLWYNRQIKKDNTIIEKTIIEKTNYSNDSLRIELKHIDKDKNEKIIEVKGLNNDSTYKLFKQLIAE